MYVLLLRIVLVFFTATPLAPPPPFAVNLSMAPLQKVDRVIVLRFRKGSKQTLQEGLVVLGGVYVCG